MGRKPTNWWIMVAAGLFAAAFLLKDFVLHAHIAFAKSGAIGLLMSSTMQHKVGELLIGAPLFMTALMRQVWPAERLLANLKAARPLMLIGSVLNILAWFGSLAPWTDVNRLWFPFLVVVGVVAPPLLIRLLGKGNEAEAEALPRTHR